MTKVADTQAVPVWGLGEMADNMAEFVLSRIGEDRKTTRWSAGLALVCFAPDMPALLHQEVRRRLVPLLSA